MLINQRNTIMHPMIEMLESLPEDIKHKIKKDLFRKMVTNAVNNYHTMKPEERAELTSNLEQAVADLGGQIAEATEQHTLIVNALLEMEKLDGEDRAQ